MEIIAYTTSSCLGCSALKELFEKSLVTFKEIKLGEDITPEDFRLLFPEHNDSMPYVIIDGEKIGGLVEVARLFVSKGLILSNVTI